MSHAPFDAPFAHGIYKQKYSKDGTEEWCDTARRVPREVFKAIDDDTSALEVEVGDLIENRKALPGGRYLYAAGRDLHQVQNCALYRAEDTREGWSDLVHKSTMSLMTGAGIGVWYGDVRPSGSVITRTGGIASGPISLMRIVNELGRNVMQGGARRSAIWAGLPWWHADVFEFIRSKDWAQEVRDLKDKDFTFPADLDMTNISVTLDKDFFDAYEGLYGWDERVSPDPTKTMTQWAHEVYWLVISKMTTTAEPGFSVDYDNPNENLRNAPVAAGTHVLTSEGYRSVGSLVGRPISLWTGTRFADNVVFERTQAWAPIVRVAMTGGREIRCEPSHEFLVEDWTGAGNRRRLEGIRRVAAADLSSGDVLHVALPGAKPSSLDEEDYTLGFIYGDGSFTQAGGADLTLCSAESKACSPVLVGATSVNEHDSRGFTRMYFGVDHPRFDGRAKDTYPLDVDDPASFIAGLFDADGNYEPRQKRIRLASKHREFLCGVRRELEALGILSGVSKAGTSTYGQGQGWQLVVNAEFHDEFARLIPTVRLKPDQHASYRRSAIKVLSVEPDGYEDVFCADVGVPEHSFMAEGVIISNCTEITSEDDSDICNLGSINLARFDNLEDFASAVFAMTGLLVAGTVYSELPHAEVHATREKNRRLGLGLMGVHEWLLKRGHRYEANDELATWLDVYQQVSDEAAGYWATRWGLSVPVKVRAIAPNGTIGIIAETTTSAEPIFAAAVKRRVRSASTVKDKIEYEYVVDPTAARLVASGVDPNTIEDAYLLSYDVERRVAFQAWLQQWVDHGISSTVNLPHPYGPEEQKEFGDMLIGYLPKLRGITAYPDGSRGGQPLTAVPLEYALAQGVGVRFEENEDRCVGGLCGV